MSNASGRDISDPTHYAGNVYLHPESEGGFASLTYHELQKREASMGNFRLGSPGGKGPGSLQANLERLLVANLGALETGDVSSPSTNGADDVSGGNPATSNLASPAPGVLREKRVEGGTQHPEVDGEWHLVDGALADGEVVNLVEGTERLSISSTP